jgi:hypothetical protein
MPRASGVKAAFDQPNHHHADEEDPSENGTRHPVPDPSRQRTGRSAAQPRARQEEHYAPGETPGKNITSSQAAKPCQARAQTPSKTEDQAQTKNKAEAVPQDEARQACAKGPETEEENRGQASEEEACQGKALKKTRAQARQESCQAQGKACEAPEAQKSEGPSSMDR